MAPWQQRVVPHLYNPSKCSIHYAMLYALGCIFIFQPKELVGIRAVGTRDMFFFSPPIFSVHTQPITRVDKFLIQMVPHIA